MKRNDAELFALLKVLLVVLVPGLCADIWLAFWQTSAAHLAVRAWGNDFRFFFQAAQSIWEGESPYRDWFFTSPPLAAFLNLPLAGLPFERAFPIFVGTTMACVLAALWLLTRRLVAAHRGWCLVLLFMILGGGLPFQFLLGRGNIDGVVLFFLVVGVWLIPRCGFTGGVLLGLAASLKFYPLLLLLPLTVLRLKRALAGALAAIGALAFVAWPHWSAFWERLLTRAGEFRLDENVSFAMSASYLFSLTPASAAKVAMALFATILAAQSWADWRDGQPKSPAASTARLSLYFPLMAALPSLVFNYELILVVASLPALLWLIGQGRPEQRWLPNLMLVAAGLTQLQSVLFFRLTGLPFAHFLPAGGLFLLTAAIAAQRLLQPVKPASI